MNVRKSRQQRLSGGKLNSDEKECPLCAEIIKINAVICKHCQNHVSRSGRTASKFSQKDFVSSNVCKVSESKVPVPVVRNDILI